MKYIPVFFIATLFFATTHPLVSQTLVSKSVLANGGDVVSDSSYRIVGTIGQTLIGLVTGEDQISAAGFWYIPVEHVTSVEDAPETVPTEFRLEQNYPNPFNPVTTIQFALPQTSQVALKLFDLLGREVTTLVDGELQAGVHKILFDANRLPSGVYIYRIYSNSEGQKQSFVRSRKFVLLK